MERMGFLREGAMPERWFIHVETADTVYYGLLRRYWDTRAKAAPRSDAREARKLSR